VSDDHDDDHHDGHEHAPHPRQPDVEDQPLTYHMALAEAVADLLVAKAVLTRDELRRTLEDIDARSPAAGARSLPGRGSTPPTRRGCWRT
jgi:nitrile hydratase